MDHTTGISSPNSMTIAMGALAQSAPQILEQFDYMEKEIARLHETVGVLEMRLGPVVVQEPPTGDTKNASSPQPVLVPLAERLSSNQNMIRSVAMRIESLLKRLQI